MSVQIEGRRAQMRTNLLMLSTFTCLHRPGIKFPSDAVSRVRHLLYSTRSIRRCLNDASKAGESLPLLDSSRR